MPMMSATEALTELTALAEASLFQPQQAPNPRIHVLGLLEASGCTFDSLWVMGMTDECLPKATQLSAFIAHDLQRELNMPHANVTRELQWADTLLQRLQQSTLNCVFSHARLVDDNPCLPSPLIRHLPAKSISPPPEIEQHQLERYDEQETFALPLTQKTPGGTALLAHQAQCPFKAFAAHRLHAKIEHEISEGLNSLERGQLIHRCLELLWAHLKNQQTLLHYPPQKLNQRIEACIEEALAPFAMENRLSFPALIQQIETQRLKQLIEACLNEERRRESFEVIAVEYATEVQLADLTFRIKLDRLDELPSGHRWVIDYKTQLPSRKPWHDERPEAPQLLMYGLLDADIHGLIFMEISQGHVIWAGLCDEPSNIKGMRCPPAHQSWAEQRDAWQQQLTQLANEFQRGHCAPTPTRLSLCTRCDFKPLCRVT
jgi:probable DNA repair protein